MKKKIISVCLAAIGCLLLGSGRLSATPQQPSAPSTTERQASSDLDTPDEEAVPPGQVEIEGRLILTVYEPVAALSPVARAEAIAGRIVTFARDSHAPSEAIRIQPRDMWTEIVVDNTMIMAVTEGDARAAGKTRQQLALEDVESIRQAVETYRQDHSWRVLFRGIIKAVVATLALLIALWVVRWLRFALGGRIEGRIKASRDQRTAWHVALTNLGPIILSLGAFVRWFLILALLETYLTVTLGFFSSTREISLTATRWVFSQLESLTNSALDYLPNLLVVAVIAVVTYYVARLIQRIFKQIAKGELKILGFYPDWAEPTEKLIRMMVIVLALVVAFPYLPGAKSPAFKGITIFVGVLLSLGSSSAVANTIAGIILTYMRSFLAGDWVQIGDTTGEVIERTLLVTRVLTPKAEVITIPNSSVMNGAVKNYSIEARKSGVIFYTTVSIGFDTPWRTVHQLLISAAMATKHVLQQPAPFVLQRSLDDFYVIYELNAYTDAPREVLNIYSDLHQNIQDKFNEAGVEICSPHISALREGNMIEIPEQYIKPGYKVPSFRINLTPGDGTNE